jgi:hypothetical protein
MIAASENFFSRLGFDAHKDLEKGSDLFKGRPIEDKLADKVYYYGAPDHTNTSFYFFDSPDLTTAEKTKIKSICTSGPQAQVTSKFVIPGQILKRKAW